MVAGRKKTVVLDLERPSDLRKLEDPEFFFATQADQMICIDEVQRVPDLFSIMRSAIDADRRNGRFLILGSASQDLIRQSSETLAGRIQFLELTPFTLEEMFPRFGSGSETVSRAWLRGGFPESVLAETERVSLTWRESFVRTFLERDLGQLGFNLSASTMRRFWTMLAHYHGNLLNGAKLGQALGVSIPTVGRYLDALEQTYMVRVLRPLEINLKKRMVKSPKVYLRDSGVLHALLEIENLEGLMGHPVVGASWEGHAMENIITAMSRWRPSFYRTSGGEEIDLVLERGRKRLVFEFKASMSPRVSRGFAGTLEVLQPACAWVVAPVKEAWELPQGAKVCDLTTVLSDLAEFVA